MVSLNGSGDLCTVAVDAMGGDHAPDEVLKGAAEALRGGTKIVLVGPRARLLTRLSELALPAMDVQDASETIGMDEQVRQVRRKGDSSIHVATRLLQTGEAHAVVSAGNSAAIMAIALLECGRQTGIDRPAFGTMMPTKASDCFILDIGANPVVKPSNLVQFAVMGEVYVRVARGIERPRVALLSNGTEPSKGTEEVKEAHEQLSKLDLDFVGNLEGNHVFDGIVDVVVCDGFAGNVLLKGVEGAGSFLFDMVREEIGRDFWGKFAAAALIPAFNRVRRRVDYQEYGGAPVLGVNGIVINCHGRSKARAIAKAIFQADKMARERLVERIGDALQRDDVEMHRRRLLARALHLRGEKA
jgi:glycerol-3-phosphate acyltransferase PlsX